MPTKHIVAARVKALVALVREADADAACVFASARVVAALDEEEPTCLKIIRLAEKLPD